MCNIVTSNVQFSQVKCKVLNNSYSHVLDGNDFITTTEQLIFTPDNANTSQFFQVMIIGDMDEEGPEKFQLQVITTEQHVIINPSEITIYIIDDEGKYMY